MKPRLLAGIGNGMTTSTIPVWHAETSLSHNRGRNVCIELGVNIFGVMLAYWCVNRTPSRTC